MTAAAERGHEASERPDQARQRGEPGLAPLATGLELRAYLCAHLSEPLRLEYPAAVLALHPVFVFVVLGVPRLGRHGHAEGIGPACESVRVNRLHLIPVPPVVEYPTRVHLLELCPRGPSRPRV